MDGYDLTNEWNVFMERAVSIVKNIKHYKKGRVTRFMGLLHILATLINNSSRPINKYIFKLQTKPLGFLEISIGIG